ncbi:MAG: NADH:ubiquinone oxidoreductase subunit 6 (subunit J) [Roseivirga sp.]|jgi:NADH:ubiquinone oxidoreductase subunit 6 (subunit J)
MNLLNKLYQIFLSEHTKNRIEKTILNVALFGFFIHLILIYLSKFGIINFHLESDLFKNPISAIYTPFSFILVYEVYLLIYYLPKSFTTYITKQYEIITLIIIRKLFKDLSSIELTSDWFDIKGDLQFTYDILASIILFYLIFQFEKHGTRKLQPLKENEPIIEGFIRRKKIIAVVLVPIFFIMALSTLFNWSSDISFTSNNLPSFETINNLFFDEFFTVLILVDVVLLLISFFYTDKFHKIIRNSGFVVSTILIRMSFGVSGLISTILVVLAVLFGLAIMIIHNKYEKNTPPNRIDGLES